MKKDFDNEPIYNKEYFKTKTKFHGNEVTDFYSTKIPKVDSYRTCFGVISLDLVLKKDESYYPQVFLKECKYIEKKVFTPINNNLSDFFSSDDADQE